MNLYFKAFLLSLLIVYAFSLKGIGLNPIKPYHLNQGKSTSYLFSISPEEEILTKAKVKITFPYEFDHSKIASNLKCMARSSSYNWKDVPCQYSSPSVIITLGAIKDQATDVLVSQPVNPVIFTMSSYFSICFVYDNTVTTCNKEFGKVVFPSTPTLTNNTNNGNITSLVQSLNSNTVGQASTYQFTFGLSASYGIGSTIRVKFPIGFTTTQSPICQIAGTFNQVIKTFVWPDKRSIECQSINSTLSQNQSQVLKIIGIYNPQYAGDFGNTAEGFVIELLKGTTTISLEQIYPQSLITIQTGTLIGRIDQQNNFVKSKSKYTFYLNLQNALTSSNYIQMKFPVNWVLYDGKCSIISGLTIGNRTLSCKNSTTTDPDTVIMNISNFQSATVSNQIVLSLVVGTPNILGQYNIETTTGNYFGVMDKMTTKVILNSTYGTIDMLSINAITANAKVDVGKTGPLELTFFLNYQLPQTNVLTEGKFIMKIYPRILQPDPLVNGVLKCYFFNNIPAKTCIWDDTESAAYTKVTITTPETASFQYSQIPITLTTQGALNDSMIGITIADVVTRYRFELQAYKQNNATTPTEVYYTEYIADAIPLPLTTYSFTNQMNEYTHLRLQFIGPYDFTPSTVQDIRFKIQFLNSGWATNLGYNPNTIYKRFPCLLSESTANPPTYNSQVVCDLYTYLDGPHASLTDSSSRGPYILMYGFYPSLIKNYDYRIELPRFLIGSSSNIDTKIRFSIIQQTPDMLTKYIELYYNEVVLFTTTTTAASVVSVASSVISNSQINVYSTHTNTFTVPNNGLSIIYEYDQISTQSFTNQNFQCTSTNWCVSLGYPVNWIIEYKDAGTFSTSISSQFAITNGVYADTFTGKVRVFKVVTTTATALQTKNIMTSLYKSTFTYIYTPSLPTGTQFAKSDTYSGMYKNMEQYYLVTFYPYTTTPSNGFIRLSLSTEMKFSTTAYCEAVSIPVLDTKLGLLCSLQNSRSTLKIYNIGGLSAGSPVQVKVRIATELGSAASISPTIIIKTYRTLTIDTSVVDQKTGLTLSSSPYSNQLTSPVQFTINNPRTVPETPRVNYIGRLEFKFIPSSNSISTPAAKIKVYFHDHPWNGGKFTTPNNNVADPLVCKLNRKRVDCTYTLNPMIVTMNVAPAGLTAGTDNFITLDTQYLAPDNGIKHPSQGGNYMTTLYFYDSILNELQKTTFTHQIKASKLRNLVIRSTVHDVGVENMFKIWFQTFGALTVNANNHLTLYSRILIEFPTKDSLGNNLFASDLGGYKDTGDYVGCNFYFYNGASNYVKAGVTEDYMKCRLIKSQVDGDPVRVEIINHGAFTSANRWMRVFIAKIFNPSIAVTSVPVTVRIQHIQVATNNVYELYHDTYDVFMNSQNPTLQQTNGTRSTRSNSFENGKNISDQGLDFSNKKNKRLFKMICN